MTLPPKKRVVSIRVKVPAGTTIESPVSIRVQLQNPIIDDIFILASGASMNESGFQVLINGSQSIPSPESVTSSDMASGVNWIPLWEYPANLKDIGIQIPGSPYAVDMRFYNLTAGDVYASVILVTSPKIELKNMPIQDDPVSKKPEYDS